MANEMVDVRAWLYWGFSNLFRGAVTVAPVLASPLRSHIVETSRQSPPLLWPPVGGMTVYAAPLASLVIGLFGWGFSKRLKKNTAANLRTAGLVVAILSLLSFSYLLLGFVKEVFPPSGGVQYRSIGFDRTDAAKRVFPSTMPDVEVLKAVGLDDGSIESAWTPTSVLLVRLGLLATYILCLSSINYVVGISSVVVGSPAGKPVIGKPQQGVGNSGNDSEFV
jgi:hypothetical protein